MKKCSECGGTMAREVRDHHDTESGLDDVILRGVTAYRCGSCGTEAVQIRAIEKLHQAIADELAAKPSRLIPAEVKFLRGHLGLTNKAFADLMGVSAEQASRWTSSEPMGMPAEHLLRMFAILGPEAFSESPTLPAAVFGRPLLALLSKLPGIKPQQKIRPIALSQGREGWTAAA